MLSRHEAGERDAIIDQACRDAMIPNFLEHGSGIFPRERWYPGTPGVRLCQHRADGLADLWRVG